VAKPGDVLAVLDIADLTHPKLASAITVNAVVEHTGQNSASAGVLEHHAIDEGDEDKLT